MSIDFYSVLCRYYDEIFPLKPGKVQLIRDQLSEPPCNVLEIGCATGRLAMRLAGSGYRMTGLDLNPMMIADARKRAAADSIPVAWVESDMAALAEKTMPGTFHGIVCLGNTLAHLPDMDAVIKFLSQCRIVLTPGGIIILQLVNFERFMGGEPGSFPVIENDHVRFTREYLLETLPESITFLMTLTDKSTGETVSRSTPLIPITCEQLKSAMADAGFDSVECFGDFTGSAWEPDSAALIMVGKS